MFANDIGLSQSPATATPEVDTLTTPVKDCCGVLLGDLCDCEAFAAEARGVFARPIMCRPASQWGV
jgi:hypothetical protein